MRRILASTLMALAVSLSPAYADGDAAKGKKVFNKCKACHMVGPNAKNRIGPPLNGIVGAQWAKIDGFRYSSALEEAADGRIWDEATLDAFLEKPKKLVPKTRMTFAGLRKPNQRADVIAYLKQFNADGSKAE